MVYSTGFKAVVRFAGAAKCFLEEGWWQHQFADSLGLGIWDDELPVKSTPNVVSKECPGGSGIDSLPVIFLLEARLPSFHVDILELIGDITQVETVFFHEVADMVVLFSFFVLGFYVFHQPVKVLRLKSVLGAGFFVNLCILLKLLKVKVFVSEIKAGLSGKVARHIVVIENIYLVINVLLFVCLYDCFFLVGL